MHGATTAAPPNRVREWRDMRGMSLEALADAIEKRTGVKISPSKLNRIETGQRSLKTDALRLIASGLGVPWQELLARVKSGRSKEHTLAVESIMVRGQAEAGVWREAVERDESEWYAVTIPTDPIYAAATKFGLEFRGPSMDRHFPEGTVGIFVRVEELPHDIASGDRVLVERRRPDGHIEATVKEFVVDEQGKAWLWPRSNHPEYQAPVAYDDVPNATVRITALLIGSYRPERRSLPIRQK